ncbi:uncharacterized protein PAC_14089 [Phialocephala subalpina]|uniref:SnoaL-like domain-containing protein n=1 Tax=Phialocephala subalpina TaxID=576137 RepID=A0A1L7XGP7_9HELO|nr:uncharacterized protein PAC_14089 [Phialocephala subalpina]
MYKHTKSRLALALTTRASTVDAFLNLHDPVLGIAQQRPYCPARPASPEFQRAALCSFISEIFFEQNGITTAFENFISPDYIQHSLFILSGRNNTLSLLESLGGGTYTGVIIAILHVMFDSPFGMMHYKFQVPGQQPQAFMHLWRFNGTCIEEHRDVIQSLPANATSPIALFQRSGEFVLAG